MTPNNKVLFGLGLETGVDQVSEMLGMLASPTMQVSTS